MSVDEKAIQARRDEIAAAGTLSAQAIESHEAALAHLKSLGLSHDQATLELQQKGADAVLAEKAKAESDAASATALAAAEEAAKNPAAPAPVATVVPTAEPVAAPAPPAPVVVETLPVTDPNAPQS